MRKHKTTIRAWIHQADGTIYMKVGKHWYEWGFTYSETASSVAWMRQNCLELHPRDVKRLNKRRLAQFSQR